MGPALAAEFNCSHGVVHCCVSGLVRVPEMGFIICLSSDICILLCFFSSGRTLEPTSVVPVLVETILLFSSWFISVQCSLTLCLALTYSLSLIFSIGSLAFEK